MSSKRELRIHRGSKFQIRKSGSGSRSVSGHFAVFDSLSQDLGGFREKISPGAFADSLKDRSIDPMALYNHDSNLILGKRSSKTLDIREDSQGLAFDLSLPSTSYADDLCALMDRGDVSACSFAFAVDGDDGDDWQVVGDQLIRTLKRVKVFEGSIVGSPAYEDASAMIRTASCPVALRSRLRAKKKTNLTEDDPAINSKKRDEYTDEELEDLCSDESSDEFDEDICDDYRVRSASIRLSLARLKRTA